jgi:succinate-semialdehyde dehydrogenase/glutarate-semialdehyde dehydrogenase
VRQESRQVIDYRTLDPSTGELIERFTAHADSQVDRAIDRSVKAFSGWSATSLKHRADLLLAVASRLESGSREHGALMALEMGKLLREGEAEAKKCAWACRYYAENAELFLIPSVRASDGSESWVSFEPLGPVLAIMPWNFPFWQLFRFAAPALMAGNSILLKHAPNTPRCALAIERLMLESGFPEALLQNLFLTNEQAAAVIADRRVRAVTLTGSTRAGRSVGAAAGRSLKPMVLELGGSDAFVVLDDADLDPAIAEGVASRCLNNGQSCIAAKRFIVLDAVFDRFRDRFVAEMSERVAGDPRLPGTRLGPLAREDLRDVLGGQVDRARAAGGRILAGGATSEGPGFYYPATVIADLPPDSEPAREELFGPAALLFRCRSEDEAIAIANGTDYGLGASLWTRDAARAKRLVPRIQAGSVFVNGLVKSDPRLPFGGIKDSGFGRELSREGILEFVNFKTVWMR